MNVHSGDQGSVTFPPQVYEIILNSGMFIDLRIK